ncbi:LacI family DNA-binding transcriptional regulator [Sporosarcina sp. FSL K6-6792]|uniref:LacI family DNA-binding transcriptional regulator n=1 Tax=Sporosarcina sp. FSL K6-6792 TaxID=2921559 RepID=UPI0030F53F13
MATIQDVARKAGVSVATVSRVLNNQNVVAKETTIKVEKAIKELNYEPSVLGRNLRTSESRLLLVLIPSIANPFYTEIIKGIEDTAIEKDYNILLCETGSNPKREAIYINLVRNRLADGVISMDPAVDKVRLTELANKYPVVQCSEYDKAGTISYVTIDSELAAYQAVRYLIQIGHKRIGLINSDNKYLYARERYEGYIKALNEFEIPINTDWIYNVESVKFQDGQQAMRSLLDQPDRPTAIFADSDVLAIGALKEINSSGLNVPKDIALVGFDNIDFSNMTYPTLTTISQPMYEMGSASANMIIQKISGKKVGNIILNHEFVIREST